MNWGQQLCVDDSERIVVCVTRDPDTAVHLTASAFDASGTVKWVVAESHATQSSAAVLGRAKASGLPALAIHVDRIGGDVAKLVVVAAQADHTARPLGALEIAVHLGADVRSMPTIMVPGGAVTLVEVHRHHESWRLLAVGEEPRLGQAALPGQRLASAEVRPPVSPGTSGVSCRRCFGTGKLRRLYGKRPSEPIVDEQVPLLPSGRVRSVPAVFWSGHNTRQELSHLQRCRLHARGWSLE